MIAIRRNIIKFSALMLIALSMLFAAGCEPGAAPNNSSSPSPSPSASPSGSPKAVGTNVPVTLPVLDAMFSDDAFKTKLKSEVELTDAHITQLQKIAADEVMRLRQANIEEKDAEPERQAEVARESASRAIRDVIGDQKADKFFAFVSEYWTQGGEPTDASKTAATNGAGLNSVPKDTRVVVNIPAYRMDVFREGTLVKSYKVGIGYPEFPLPTGMRKASTIIFNPTWTPPDEPWVEKMKGVEVGEKVAAGSKLNPLGPIKIPIGLPSLIHGGKSPAKLGTFASHGCVGLTTPQVQDFSKLLAQVAGGELTDRALQGYAKDKTKTEVVKLNHAIPVELRYETIVVEDGKLKIFRDVYDQDTNTETNLRAVLETYGVKLEDLSEQERSQVLETLNAMSAHPAKRASATASPAASPEAKKADQKSAVAKTKPIGKNQKEVVIEIAALKGMGYPVAVNLDTGSGKPAATVAMARPTSTPAVKKP